MIYFITERKDHDPFIYRSQKISVSTSFDPLLQLLKENKVVGFDGEWVGVRYFMRDPLLIQIGNKETQIVIDYTETVPGWRNRVVEAFNSLIREDHLFIGHNLKSDYLTFHPLGFKLPDFFDTMIAEQRLTLGTGLLCNLKDTYERRLKKFFPSDKEIREDFSKMNKSSKFLVKHLIYAAGDVEDVLAIATIQKELLSSTGQAWFVRNVEFPLIKVLGNIELKGLYLKEDKWSELIAAKRKRRLECAVEMDKEIATVGKGNMYVTGGKFATKRKGGVVIQPDLFGNAPTETENKNTHNLNYNSPQQVVDVIVKLGLPKPTFVTKDKEGKATTKNSIKEEAINEYLMTYPNTPLKSFFGKLLEYKGLQKFISSYGLKFLHYMVKKEAKYEFGFKNPITNRVHTVLKQCFTETGRLSSGDKAEGLFNIQNLPAEPEVRQCFSLSPEEIATGYKFTTIDLSGAELTIMAALADDQHLYELGADRIIDGKKIEGDAHSPTATKCWRAVYQYRKSKAEAVAKTPDELIKLLSGGWYTIQDSKGKKYELTADFIVDKKTNKPLRTDFKPMIFGCVYGLMAKKGGETLNIPKDEAQVVIDVIKGEFPKTFKMVEEAANFALRHGYVVFNSRSNNRRYFQPVLDILATIDQTKYPDHVIINYVKEKLGFKVTSEITGEARNCRIQGTQADMIKESLVDIARSPNYKATEARLLLSVHDENGLMHKGEEFGEECKQIMINAANKYLEPYSKHIKMGAEKNTLLTWTK